MDLITRIICINVDKKWSFIIWDHFSKLKKSFSAFIIQIWQPLHFEMCRIFPRIDSWNESILQKNVSAHVSWTNLAKWIDSRFLRVRIVSALVLTFMSYPAGLSHSKRKMVNADTWTATTSTRIHDAASNGSELETIYSKQVGNLKISVHTCSSICVQRPIDVIDLFYRDRLSARWCLSFWPPVL